VSDSGATASMHNTSFLRHTGLLERDGMASMHAVFPEDTSRAVFCRRHDSQKRRGTGQLVVATGKETAR
jgi:hypothetical protein